MNNFDGTYKGTHWSGSDLLSLPDKYGFEPSRIDEIILLAIAEELSNFFREPLCIYNGLVPFHLNNLPDYFSNNISLVSDREVERRSYLFFYNVMLSLSWVTFISSEDKAWERSYQYELTTKERLCYRQNGILELGPETVSRFALIKFADHLHNRHEDTKVDTERLVTIEMAQLLLGPLQKIMRCSIEDLPLHLNDQWSSKKAGTASLLLEKLAAKRIEKISNDPFFGEDPTQPHSYHPLFS